MKLSFYIILVCLLISSCKRSVVHINHDASIPEVLGFEEMGLKAISTMVNPSANTTGVLYANNSALQSMLKTDTMWRSEKILVFITWNQKNDPRWFGAMVPADFKTMEILRTKSSFDQLQNINYEIISKGINQKVTEKKRIEFITKIKPAVMP